MGSESALAQVHLLEFGLDVSWIMCRNAMCPNFGVPYNRAVRPLARRCLSLSLPFADCPGPNCANHGMNLFEPWAAAGERLYRRNNEHQVVCLACRRRFGVGEALHLRRGTAAKQALQEVLDSVGKRAGTITRVRDATGMGVGGHYARLLRSATSLRDYSAWRSAGLWIYLLLRNYTLRVVTAQGRTPAQVR